MGTEAILFTPAVGLALSRVLVLLLIPATPVIAALRAVRLIGSASTRWSPAQEVSALLIGALAAPVVLSTSAFGGTFGFADIFRPNGPWDLSFRGFLAQRALPLLGAPFECLRAVGAGEAGADATGMTLLLGLLAALLIAGPALLLRSRIGLTTSLRNATLLVWGLYATMYAMVSLLWLGNKLNFWCFLVLFVALSFRRD